MNVDRHLEAYLVEARVRRFDWHTFSCSNFGAEWVARAERRVVVVPPLREQLRMRDLLGSVAAVVSVVIGRPPLDHTRNAQAGDILLLPSKRPERAYIGICCGRYAAFLPLSGEELAFVSWTDTATHAWRVEKELLT